MNSDAFFTLLSHFAERPLPARVGRHVYLWLGSTESLKHTIPSHVLRVLDLHQLAAGLSGAPRSVDAARRLINRALRSQLDDLISLCRQQVLVVTGCDVLSRYQAPLIPFFEIASEHVMVVFTVRPAETHAQPIDPLPDYVSWNPGAPLEFMRSAISKEAVISHMEEL